MTGNFSVVEISKPLLSVGKLIEYGHTVHMDPSGGYIQLKDGAKVKIYLRNGVWKLPTWAWDIFQGRTRVVCKTHW